MYGPAAAEETDIRDIKGPLSIQGQAYLYILIALLAVIVITVLVLLFLKKRKKPEEIVIPPVPAHETAYRAFDELMKNDYLKKGHVQEYYFELSNIVRHYVENRFSLRAPEMTTEEFLSTLRDSDTLNSGQKGLMREFLSHCDMVKFAKYLPDQKEAESSYEAARKIVDETKL
ncbi:MAG TPA: hypothetical protein ENG83_08285 [Nitrospirae bacterium]|nr:hypothetical protein BMS3Abin06_00193 [bacterium BMS3Abin06]HDH12172.1 hypothetical protein [Nitrospirota bacterium]HDZ03112.1 hypothetical protein [Nitrospirota bacterium]